MVRANAASEGEPSDGESFTDGDFCDSSSGDEGDAPGALRDPAGRQGALPVDEALNPNVKTQQDHAPVTQQDHAPETQHDHALQMQQEHEPETQRDHAPETQRDHEPETQRDHALETQREHEPETQRDHALETQREHEMDTQQVERRGSHVAEQPSIVGIIGMEHDEAEARLAARRAARAEAREIRMRELERQQREHEDNADKAYDMYSETVSTRPAPRATRLSATLSPTVHSPRRTSEDSTEEVLNIKDLRHDMKEVEEKFRKAMILNAQLDNDKASLSYQLELLKDRIEDLQEQHAQLQREHKEKCSAYERLKREHAQTEDELAGARAALVARDNAIAAAGLALVEAMEDAEAPLPPGLVNGGGPLVPVLALISKESNDILESAGEGTLDVRLQKLSTDKRELESEVRRLKLQLEEERCRERTHNGPVNGTTYNDYDSELETSKRLASEYKYRATKAEQEAALLGASAARLEAQVQRLRAAAERAEEAEDELKADKRRLQREAREALNRVEELETENSHLTKRLDKLKNAKSALLKEL